jgi:hypothetical protein
VLPGCITHNLKGFLTGMLTLGSQIASPVGYHPLIMSHFKFRFYFALQMLMERQFRFFSHIFLLHCHNGSPHLSLQLWARKSNLRCSKPKDPAPTAAEESIALYLSFRFFWCRKMSVSCFSLRQVFHFSTDRIMFCYDSSSGPVC